MALIVTVLVSGLTMMRAPPLKMTMAPLPIWQPWRLLGNAFSPGLSVPVEVPGTAAQRVAQFMTPASECLLLPPEMPLDEAACKLAQAGISGAPVVGPSMATGESRLLGVLSQKDLLHSAAGRCRVRFTTTGPRSERHIVNSQRLRNILRNGNVASVMSTRLTTVKPDDSVRDAARVLLERNINRLLVVDDKGGLVGLLSTTDIMETITSSELGCRIFD
jgi:CBS domain-containing protein